MQDDLLLMTAEEARTLALSMAEAVELDHHGRPSFRVAGRIYATLWTPTALNVMASEARIVAAAAERPDVCAEVWWGKRLAAVRVDLPHAEAELVEELLADAWSRRAPRRLLRS
jgi:hypothetical protein